MAVCRSFKVTMVFRYWKSGRQGLYGRLRFSFASFNSEPNTPQEAASTSNSEYRETAAAAILMLPSYASSWN